MGRGKKARLLHGWYGVVFALLTLLVGVLIVIQVWSIYRTPIDKPYTKGNISAHFREIAPFVWAWLIALAGNILLSLFLPKEPEKLPKYQDYGLVVKRLRARLPDDGKCVPGINKGRGVRIVLWCLCIFAIVATAAVSRFYLSKTAYTSTFVSEFFSAHGGTAERLIKILPWIFSSLLLVFAVYEYEAYRRERQAETLKDFISADAKAKKEAKLSGKTEDQLKRDELASTVAKAVEACAKDNRLDKLEARIQSDLKAQEQAREHYKEVCAKVAQARERKAQRAEKAKGRAKLMGAGLWAARIGIFAAAVVLLVIGISNDGMLNLWEKAEKICTQCIGLG